MKIDDFLALPKGVQPAVVRAWNRREWRAGE